MKFTTILLTTLSLATLGLASPRPQTEIPGLKPPKDREPCDLPSCDGRCGTDGVLKAACDFFGGTICVCNREGDPGFGKGKANQTEANNGTKVAASPVTLL
ncbi:hypothetical protein HYFRA_00001011 [Hymenoscyphus fraxineus]|uniref:Extracellular membrane protein CFEM domain-containing protein n=1 Tax=Hymenoscyphus fraxineus TaxID=746836 RepID=A0A9N9KRP2_9HELO|nr:hypothetical protein HYFRA_00001011 [Hymenoscyphus fraxineus]